MKLDDVDTPALLVDLQIVKENIARAQKYADAHGLKLRPHIKTHKLAEIAKLQIDAGACGINCQKISEAEVLVKQLGPHTPTDVLLTFNIVGARKLKHLVELAKLCTKLTVVADSSTVIQGYIDSASAAYSPSSKEPLLNIMVECDTGGLRAGVVEPSEALELAQQIQSGGPAVQFAGLMTYPAAGKMALLSGWLKAAKILFDAAGIPIPAVTVGGTPEMWSSHQIGPIVTEMRPGTYVYNDRAILKSGAAQPDWCAQTVLATVVSRPTPTRAVCDAGSKALSSDLLGLSGHGHILEFPDARISRISEEHGVIEADRADQLPKIGDRIHIIPNHACVVTNLFDSVHIINNDDISVLPIKARGKMQ